VFNNDLVNSVTIEEINTQGKTQWDCIFNVPLSCTFATILQPIKLYRATWAQVKSKVTEINKTFIFDVEKLLSIRHCRQVLIIGKIYWLVL